MGKSENVKKNITKSLLFILSLSVLFLGYQSWYNFKEKREDKQLLKIGFFTDAHFNAKKNKKKNIWELDWRSREALERFVKKMNDEFQPDFVVENGDFVDGKDKRSHDTWQEANQLFQQVRASKYHILGNHETNSFTKDIWLKLTGYDKTYYDQDIDKKDVKYKILFLDANFLPDGTDASPDKHYYPGYINKDEWQWLENKLQEAKDDDRRVVVFIHQPPVSTDFFLNYGVFPQGKQLHQLFNKFNVLAVFSGHIENLCNIEDGATKYFVLQGFWKGKKYLKKEYRFKDAGAFYYITINSQGEIKVVMERRVFDDNIKKGNHLDKLKGWFRLNVGPSYSCQDGRQLEKNNSVSDQSLKKPLKYLPLDLPELSGITFLKNYIFVVSDQGIIFKIQNNKIISKKESIEINPEGITTDGKYLYILSEFNNSIVQVDDNLKVKRRQKLDIKQNQDKNIGLEGIAYYKDNLFFVVHQGIIDGKNIFLVNFDNGDVIRSGQIDFKDLSGATFKNGYLYLISSQAEKVLIIEPNNLKIIETDDLDNKDSEGLDLKDGAIYLVRDNESQLRLEEVL